MARSCRLRWHRGLTGREDRARGEVRVRDEFPVAVKDELSKRVGYLCSNPACRQPTSGPQSDASGTVNIGVASHITAASPGGPRYDAELSFGQRSSAANGIWLCQTCAKLIDSDKIGYTTEKLREWKSDAEAAAARALARRRAPATESEGVFLEAERLMPRLVAEMRVDVRGDATQLVREIVPLPSHGVVFGGRNDHFEYYETDHPGLQLQLDWLLEMGLLVDVTPVNTSIYRIASEFWRWLREPAP
jgi:hypothetical protein